MIERSDRRDVEPPMKNEYVSREIVHGKRSAAQTVLMFACDGEIDL